MSAVDHRDLPPATVLLVWTANSLYRVVVAADGAISVQGGAFFPDPTAARLDPAGPGGRRIRAGLVRVGLRLEVYAAGRRVLTSPIRAIATEPLASARVH